MDVTKQCNISWFLFAVQVFLLFIGQAAAACVFPTRLSGRQWSYTYGPKSFPLTFGQSTVSGYDYTVFGNPLSDYSCISNTSDIYVLKSDGSYSDRGKNRWLYLCMRLTHVSDNLFYYYILGDVIPEISDRAFSPPAGSTIPTTDPLPNICDYCSYTTDPPNDNIRSLQLSGTSESLSGNEIVCLPCNATCDVVSECAYPDTVSHTTNVTTGNTQTDTITYTCVSGYEQKAGDLILTCQDDGTWSGTPPTCAAVSCGPLEEVADATNTSTGTGSVFGDTTTYTCNTGYEKTAGNLTRTCQADQNWSGSAPVCSALSCAPLEEVRDATNTSTGTGSVFGDTTTYTCNTGYEKTAGNLTRTCQADQNWSGSAPVCSAVSCGPLEKVTDATNTSTGTGSLFGDTTTYTCNTGYEKTAGNLTRTCQADQNWSGSAPVCSPVSCGSLGEVNHATKTSTGTGSVFGDTTTYTCNTGYEKTAGDLTRTCQADQNWSGSAPVCSPVSCGLLGEVNHATKTSTGTGSVYSDTTTYICNTGYENTAGDLTRTCQANGNWGGIAPVCSPVSCGTLGTITGTSKTQTGTVYTETTTYVCKTDYEYASGNLIRTCQANGLWSGVSPVCYYIPPTANEQVNAYVAGTIAGSILVFTIILFICIMYKLTRRRIDKRKFLKRSR